MNRFCNNGYLFGLVGLVLSGVALAEDAPALPDPTTCRGLVEADGGAAAYRPGVDAYGRAVVPAEGPAAPSGPDWHSLADGAVLDLEAEWRDLTLRLGEVTLRDGRLLVNGEPLAGAEAEAVREACRRATALRDRAGQRKPPPEGR